MKKKVLVFPLLIVIFFVMGGITVYADQHTKPPVTEAKGVPTTVAKGGFPNPFAKGGDNLYALLETIIRKVVMPIGGVLAVLAFIYSGFLYVMAQGKPAEIQRANNALLYTAIGTALLLGAWVIAEMLQNTVEKLL